MATGNIPKVILNAPGPTIIEKECPLCHGRMTCQLPITNTFNYPSVSGITFVHAKFDKCPSCGTLFTLLIKGITTEGKIEFAHAPIEIQQPNVIPGTQSNMTEALDLEKITKDMKIKLQ